MMGSAVEYKEQERDMNNDQGDQAEGTEICHYLTELPAPFETK